MQSIFIPEFQILWATYRNYKFVEHLNFALLMEVDIGAPIRCNLF